MDIREKIIRNYVNAYNNFDVEGMIADFASDIRFTNIAGGETTLVVEGLDAFKEHALQAAGLFSQRRQTITSISPTDKDALQVEIEYWAILAQDLSDELRKGHELRLSGRSIFSFNAANQVRELVDLS